MRFSVAYYKNHGWHVGRPLRWLALLALAGVTMAAGIVGSFVANFTLHHHLFLFCLGPLLMAGIAAQVLSSKLKGAPFHFQPLRASWMARLKMNFNQLHEDEWADLCTVTRESDPEAFWKLFKIEAAMWLSALLPQLVVLYLFLTE